MKLVSVNIGDGWALRVSATYQPLEAENCVPEGWDIDEWWVEIDGDRVTSPESVREALARDDELWARVDAELWSDERDAA